MKAKAKTERLEARISPEQKRVFQRAANLLGRSITDFTIHALQEAANKVIRDHEILSLSLEEQDKFVDAIFNAPEPNKRLRAAKEKHAKKINR